MAMTNGTGGGGESLQDVCKRLHDKVEAFLAVEAKNDRQRETQEQTKAAQGVIRKALEDYTLEELAISYNGGKDCLVLLILYLAVLHTFPQYTHPTISTVYVTSLHPFAEIDEFVDESVKAYHLDLARKEGALGMKVAFETYLEQRPSTKAIFVGTRRTDPHGEFLKHFDPTDHGWPSFVRIHPVIDWHYADIWAFLRALEIPYCVLYDRGYTSLGGTTDTHPNPALVEGTKDPNAPAARFRPAYELMADEEERLGRDR